MSRPISDYKKVIKLLEELHKEYPSLGLGRHFSSALSEYGDPWGMTDKELKFALEKYKQAMELDIEGYITDELYVSKIVKDAENFDDILKEPEDEED